MKSAGTIEMLATEQLGDFDGADHAEENDNETQDDIGGKPIGTYRLGKAHTVVQIEKRRRHEWNEQAAKDSECDDDHIARKLLLG